MSHPFDLARTSGGLSEYSFGVIRLARARPDETEVLRRTARSRNRIARRMSAIERIRRRRGAAYGMTGYRTQLTMPTRSLERSATS